MRTAMERTLGRRAAAGRIDRPFSRPARRRAGRARPRARRRGRPPWRAWLDARLEALPGKGLLVAIWRRRRLRIALALLALLAALSTAGWTWLRHSSLAWVKRVEITGVHGPDAGAIGAA